MPGSISRLVIKAEKQGKGPLSSLLIFPSYISYSAPANQRRELTPCPEHVQAHICVPSVTRIVLQLQFDSGVRRELHLVLCRSVLPWMVSLPQTPAFGGKTPIFDQLK